MAAIQFLGVGDRVRVIENRLVGIRSRADYVGRTGEVVRFESDGRREASPPIHPVVRIDGFSWLDVTFDAGAVVRIEEAT